MSQFATQSRPRGLRTQGRTTRPLTLGLLAMSLGNIATVGLGPLVLGVVDYPIGESMLNQLLGLELVTVAIVVPWSLWAARLCWRGEARGPMLAFGPAAYTAYMVAQYVVGPGYEEYRVVAFAHVALFSVALGVATWAFVLGCGGALPAFPPVSGRRWGLVLAALAAVVTLRYLSALLGSVTRAGLPAEFGDENAFYWSIVLLDLGVVVPATAVGAVATWRGWRHGRVAVSAVLGWFALVPPSVAAMATVMWWRDDPHASIGQTLLLWAIALAALGVAAQGLRQATRGPERTRP